jgi:DNA invertase Pin-like site-specific DNA recombinase
MDALYFRVSTDRQTTENQFEELVQVAERDRSDRDWSYIRSLLHQVVREERRTSFRGITRIVYLVRPEIARELLRFAIYVEQGRSGKKGAAERPVFQIMKKDAALRRFDRLLVWKVSRLGRDMREVIATVYELADCGVTVVPVKSQTGPITSTMGKLLWAIQAWYVEMENDERSETIRAGLARARAEGSRIGRPRTNVNARTVADLRAQGRSWKQIATELGIPPTNARRAFLNLAKTMPTVESAKY